MALDYDEARRHAMAYVDAFNRRDLDAVQTAVHEEITHQSPIVDQHLSQQHARVEGKQAYREYLRWLWAQEPPLRHVFQEAFAGPHGYAFLTHHEHDGKPVLFVREVGADGLVRAQWVYHARPPAS